MKGWPKRTGLSYEWENKQSGTELAVATLFILTEVTPILTQLLLVNEAFEVHP